ncbi:MAG: helix-turn-helix domain-containing protein [Polyangiales bacterium]
MLRPFLPHLGERLADTLDEQLEGLEPERRLHASYVHALLECAARRDPAVGVLASEQMALGDAGLLDFLMTSAATPRAALAVARSHQRLLGDVHQLSLQVEGEHACVWLEARVETPRVVEDFMIACLLRNHVLRWNQLGELRIWSTRMPPRELPPYQRAFPTARLHFEAARAGIGFPASWLEVPLRQRNRRLHAVLRRAADSELAKLPAIESTTERVLRALRAQLGAGELAMPNVARSLDQHPRTLRRALLREGTTFQALVARARKDAALHWLGRDDLSLEEVARRSGFQSKAPFHRSFRRWTGDTPQSYRRKQHGELPLPR